ncbi:MAG: hypothetical protein Q8Q29_10865, partial [Actinomycetota bacterium]|nr:hypothetical protein [Actinomycetota bacterium]
MAEGAGPEVVASGEGLVGPAEAVADGDVVVAAAGVEPVCGGPVGLGPGGAVVEVALGGGLAA